jgi:hypothetical protein
MAELHALSAAGTLGKREEAMIAIFLSHIEQVRAGKIASLAIVSVYSDGRMLTNWGARTDAAMTYLVGATFRLATEMASSFVPAPDVEDRP